MHAATLPAEILLHILELVPSPEDLCRCARVCSRWYAVANDDALWVRWAERYAVPALFQETSAKELHWREREKDRYGVWLDDRTVRMDMATTSRRSGVAGSGGSSATASDDVDVAGGLQSASTLRSPRAAFEAWHGEFRGFRELFPRMYAVVVRLSRWLRRHSPATLLSLQAVRRRGGVSVLLLH